MKSSTSGQVKLTNPTNHVFWLVGISTSTTIWSFVVWGLLVLAEGEIQQNHRVSLDFPVNNTTKLTCFYNKDPPAKFAKSQIKIDFRTTEAFCLSRLFLSFSWWLDWRHVIFPCVKLSQWKRAEGTANLLVGSCHSQSCEATLEVSSFSCPVLVVHLFSVHLL